MDLFKEIKTRYLFMQMFLTLFLGVIVLVVYSIVLEKNLTSNDLMVIPVVITSLWFLLALILLKKNNIKISEVIGKPSKKRFIFEVPVSYIVSYLGGVGVILIMFYLVYKINPHFLDILNENLGDPPTKYDTSLIKILGFLGSVIVAPITEELIFRGILLRRLYSKYSINKSIIYSSLLFFIIHLSPNPIILFLGVTCAILVYKYKSLIPGVLLHIANNFIVFMRDLHMNTEQNLSNDLNVDFSFLIFGVILLGVYILYIYKNYPRKQS